MLAKIVVSINVVIMGLCWNSMAQAALCQQWKPAEKLGYLDSFILREASGLAVSKRYSGRLYHINDSGDGPYIYTTDMQGNQTTKIEVTNSHFTDTEDLALGACGEDKDCLFVADIGDNKKRRKSVRIIILEEPKPNQVTVQAKRVINASFPDGAHNAESFAIHPNGDMFLLTKGLNHQSGKAHIYRLPAGHAIGASAINSRFDYVGAINLSQLLPDGGHFSRIATSWDIGKSGKKIIISTYYHALEMMIDLSQPWVKNREWEHGVNYQYTPLMSLPQSEAISYMGTEEKVIYTTEARGFWSRQPIYTQACK